MKCSSCGKEDFEEVLLDIRLRSVVGAYQYDTDDFGPNRFRYVHSYVCKNCGHIEFFYDLDALRKADHEQEKRQEQAAQLRVELENKKNQLEADAQELERLEFVMKHQNQTIREARETKSKINALNKEMAQLKKDMADMEATIKDLETKHLIGEPPGYDWLFK